MFHPNPDTGCITVPLSLRQKVAVPVPQHCLPEVVISGLIGLIGLPIFIQKFILLYTNNFLLSNPDRTIQT
jgi:hypothetical protein